VAEKNDKFASNVDGKFYVDDQCIACDACVMEAPSFFKMDDEEGHAFVKLQPKNEKEVEECMLALDTCPVEAIGSDGDS
jgi:ferredoxin